MSIGLSSWTITVLTDPRFFQLITKYQSDKEAALTRARESELKLKKAEEETTLAKAKLLNLRRTGAKLIRSLNEV